MSLAGLHARTVCVGGIAWLIFAAGAQAQDTQNKIEGIVPSTVRPGVIENTYINNPLPEI